MLLILGSGAKLPCPLSIGALFQSPLSMKNRESNVDGANLYQLLGLCIETGQAYLEEGCQYSKSLCLVPC